MRRVRQDSEAQEAEEEEELYFSDETPAAARRRSGRVRSGGSGGSDGGSDGSASEQVPVKLAFPGNDFAARDSRGGKYRTSGGQRSICPCLHQHQQTEIGPRTNVSFFFCFETRCSAISTPLIDRKCISNLMEKGNF